MSPVRAVNLVAALDELPCTIEVAAPRRADSQPVHEDRATMLVLELLEELARLRDHNFLRGRVVASDPQRAPVGTERLRP